MCPVKEILRNKFRKPPEHSSEEPAYGPIYQMIAFRRANLSACASSSWWFRVQSFNPSSQVFKSFARVQVPLPSPGDWRFHRALLLPVELLAC